MREFRKFRIRSAKGPRPGWKVEHIYLDGSRWCDRNHYYSWSRALDSAIHRLRRRALEATLDECELSPGEYVGLPSKNVHGRNMHEKRETIAKAALRRGWGIDIQMDHDGEGNVDFYLLKLGGVR